MIMNQSFSNIYYTLSFFEVFSGYMNLSTSAIWKYVFSCDGMTFVGAKYAREFKSKLGAQQSATQVFLVGDIFFPRAPGIT